MKKEEAEQRAYDYHNGGFHCAEAVSKAITELYADEPGTDIPKVASAFGGGAVKSYNGTCGALTGGLLAIGFLFGRQQPGIEASKATCFKLAGKLQEQFVKEAGSIHCPAVLEKLGEQKNMEKCKKLSGATARMLAEILEEQ